MPRPDSLLYYYQFIKTKTYIEMLLYNDVYFEIPLNIANPADIALI